MLLKVQTHPTNNSFRVFDNVHSVHYEKSVFSVKTLRQLGLQALEKIAFYSQNGILEGIETHLAIPPHRINLDGADLNSEGTHAQLFDKDIIDHIEGGGDFFFNLICFKQGDNPRWKSVLFDNEAYICNDNGKTIERVTGGGGFLYGRRESGKLGYGFTDSDNTLKS